MTPVSEPEPNSWLCLQSPDNHVVTVTLDNRGLAYGDGFFTTMGVIDGAILWQDHHNQRLITHAQALQLDIDSHALLISLQAHAQQLQQGVLKLIVTRAPQSVRGYGFTPSISGSACELWLKKTAMPIATAEQARLPDGRALLMQPAITAACLTAQLACLPPPLAGLKSLNRLDNVLASGELQRIKATHPSLSKILGEGLVRDMTGSWIEGTMSNVFYQLAALPSADNTPSLFSPNYSDAVSSDYLLTGQWYTPPLTQSGVTGVLRQVIIDAFALTEQPVIMRSLNDGDLSNITQMFFCNAVRGVMPVERLIND